MILKEECIDIFTLDSTWAKAQAVSEDLAMGMGIAKSFTRYYPQMKEDLKRTLLANNLHYPITLPYTDKKTGDIVFNLITKELYWYKPTYKTLQTCIEQLAYFCKEYNIKKLAMPEIGCHLDKHKWSKVKSIIEIAFCDIDIELKICHLD